MTSFIRPRGKLPFAETATSVPPVKIKSTAREPIDSSWVTGPGGPGAGTPKINCDHTRSALQQPTEPVPALQGNQMPNMPLVKLDMSTPRRIALPPNHGVRLELRETPSTGFLWQVDCEGAPPPEVSIETPPNSGLPGDDQRRAYFTWTAEKLADIGPRDIVISATLSRDDFKFPPDTFTLTR